MRQDTASGRWNALNNARSSFLARCERYASLTVPKVFTPEGYSHSTGGDLKHDFQAVGAQAVNHLTNKVMLALFAPSRPFFRLAPSDKLLRDAAGAGIDEPKLSEILAIAERNAVQVMDKKSIRPKMYDAVRQLITVGNTLLCLEKAVRVIGLKYYVCKRNVEGEVQELIIREPVKFDELDEAVQEAVQARGITDDTEVHLYKWIQREPNGKHYKMTQAVNEFELPEKFNGRWPSEKMPFRALTWDLSDDADYGTGHVEDYVADFSALSALSQAIIEGAILASEFRWLVRPAGMTAVEDMERSVNGAVIPGEQGDISIVSSQTGAAIQSSQAVAQEYIQRIGRGFLLNSAVTRNAERVTAEEIRIQAQELETALGGAYSRLAVDFQTPMAYYLLKEVDMAVNGQDFEPMIVTGLDALSRNGDLENLKLWLADMAAIAQLPPGILQQLKLGPLAAELAAARGIQTSKFMLSEEEMAQMQAAQAQQMPPEGAPTEQGPA